MRKLATPSLLTGVMIAAALLGGCNAQTSEDGNSTAQQQPPPPTAVTGTVVLTDASVQLTPQARLDLSLMDVTTPPGVQITAQSYSPVQMPLHFKLDFNPAQIKQSDIYVLQAQMQDNGRTYTTSLQRPVLTHGAPAQLELRLVAEPTASDKMLSDFKNVQSRIGGMKMTSGTASNEDASRGWQVFSDKNGVEFIRELVDRGDKGNYTSTDYAYQNGKPWVVVQETSPRKGDPVATTDRAGWDENGELVLKDHVENGKTSELPHDSASALHDQAESLYKQFNKKKH